MYLFIFSASYGDIWLSVKPIDIDCKTKASCNESMIFTYSGQKVRLYYWMTGKISLSKSNPCVYMNSAGKILSKSCSKKAYYSCIQDKVPGMVFCWFVGQQNFGTWESGPRTWKMSRHLDIFQALRFISLSRKFRL